MLVWLAVLDYGRVLLSTPVSKALLPQEWPWAVGWIRGTPLASFLLASGVSFLCWLELTAAADSSSPRKGTGSWISRVEGKTASSLTLLIKKCAVGKYPLPSVCLFRQLCEKDTYFPRMQTHGPNWRRVCNASALAFNLRLGLIGLIHRQ